MPHLKPFTHPAQCHRCPPSQPTNRKRISKLRFCQSHCPAGTEQLFCESQPDTRVSGYYPYSLRDELHQTHEMVFCSPLVHSHPSELLFFLAHLATWRFFFQGVYSNWLRMQAFKNAPVPVRWVRSFTTRAVLDGAARSDRPTFC